MKTFGLCYYKFYEIDGDLVAANVIWNDIHVISNDKSFWLKKRDGVDMIPVQDAEAHPKFTEEFLDFVQKIDEEVWKAAGAAF